MAAAAARPLRRRDRRRHARRDVLRQHGFLPVFYLPLADVRQDRRTERLDDRVALPRHRDPLALASATASPRARPGRTATRARGRPTRAGTARSTSTRWTRGTRRRSASTCTPAIRTCAPTRAAARGTSLVEVGGVRVAASRRTVLLDETGLITRYYLPLADVRHELLEPSETFTECPYKGRSTTRRCASPTAPCAPTPPGVTASRCPTLRDLRPRASGRSATTRCSSRRRGSPAPARTPGGDGVGRFPRGARAT